MNGLRHGTRATMLATGLVAVALFAAGCDRTNDATRQSSNSAATGTSVMNGTTSGSSVANSTATPSTSMARAGDDTAITAKVKTALVSEPGLKSTSIDVTTQGAVVTLSGEVPSALEKARAVQIAENVDGVKSVVDHITAKS